MFLRHGEGKEDLIIMKKKQNSNILSALLLLGWVGYLSWLIRHPHYFAKLGGSLSFLIAFPFLVWGISRPSPHRKPIIWLVLGFTGYIALNHLLAYSLVHPVNWPSFLTIMIIVQPISLFYLFTCAPYTLYDHPLSSEDKDVLYSLRFGNIFYGIGIFFGLGLFFPLIESPVHHYQRIFMMASVLVGSMGLGGIVKLLSWRHISSQELAYFLQDLKRYEIPHIDRKVLGAFILFLFMGTALETLRGLWLFWTISAFTLSVMFADIWLVYRQAFLKTSPQIIRPSEPWYSRLGLGKFILFFWVFLIVVALISNLLSDLIHR